MDMKTYLRLHYQSEGEGPMTVVKRLMNIGLLPVVGSYDFSFTYQNPREYTTIITKVHEALKGSNVIYTLTTTDI